MFDYAIGHYKPHPPSRRMLTSYILSVLSHIATVLILIRYPELLKDGVHIWTFRPSSRVEIQEPKPRLVATMNMKMALPPIEEIRKNLYDWERAKTAEGTHKPIRINLPTTIVNDVSTPPAKSKPESPIPATSPTGTAQGALVPNAPAGAPGDAARTLAEAKKPAPIGVPDATPKQAPKGIDPAPPSGIPANAAITGTSQPGAGGAGGKDAKDPGQQLRAQGPVFFDTQGFNLDEYANLVRERVRQKWEIPSNLRTFQGNVTILFYILKNGQVIGAKIEITSSNNSLDISALKAIWDSIPFPPLPRGFPAERVGARLVFAYNERQ